MKKTIASISAAAVAIATLGAAMPANAASPVGGAQFQQVASRHHTNHPKFYRQGNYAYYNGHRGDRHRHPGWRYYNGYWFPLAAFAAGALIGGAVAAQPRYVDPGPRYVAPARSGINPRHYEYCAARYRSYDSYSNTFQPNHGPRQQCYSPFY